MGFVLSQYQQVKSTPDFIEAAGAPRPLTNTIVAATGANTYPIGYFDGFLWGINSANLISKSSDMGANWTAVNASGVAATSRLMKCDDGEVIGINGGTLFKSTGWAANPATATFATKVTANGIATFLPWGLDGDGTKFIANSYSAATYSDSRYVRISLDAGATWTTKYDTLTEHGTDFNDTSHQHGCCYDPWHDRFWLSEGHNPPGGTPDLNGLYYSDDDGDTWTRAAGVYPRDESPTVLVATPNGLVLGTDSIPGGVWFLPYEADQTATDAVELYRWINEESRPGIVGFADHGYRDPTTGLVYVGFMTNFPPGVKPFIVATDGRSASRIWDSGTVARVHSLVARNGKLAANCSGHTLRADTTNTLETPHSSLIDTGNVLGGLTDNITSLSVGANSTIGSAFRSVAVGLSCEVTSSDSIGIGYGVIVDSERSVQIGDYTTASVGNDVVIAFGATNSGAGSVVIGVSTVCVGTNSVCLGMGTQVTAADAVSVGAGATAGLEGTSVGRFAVSALGAVGIGPRAGASGVLSISIGSDSDATSTYNTAIGGSSQATGAQTVTLGYGSLAPATNGIAIGVNANAASGHTNSIALGHSAVTTAASQVMVGARDIEIDGIVKGVVMKDVTLGTRHRIRLDNGVITISAAL